MKEKHKIIPNMINIIRGRVEDSQNCIKKSIQTFINGGMERTYKNKLIQKLLEKKVQTLRTKSNDQGH